MGSLVDALRDPVKMDAIVRDGAVVIDDEVRGKSGLRGMALKAGYKTLRAVHPQIVQQALRKLLPEFAPQIDPFYAKAQASGQDVRAYFDAHSGEIAEAMLSVTDRRAERAQNRVMKRAYAGLRGQAKGHVEDALPRVADLIERHA